MSPARRRPGRRALGRHEASGSTSAARFCTSRSCCCSTSRMPTSTRRRARLVAPLIAPAERPHPRGRQPRARARRPPGPTSCWSWDDCLRRPPAQGPAGGAADPALAAGDGAVRGHRVRDLPLRPRPDQPRRRARRRGAGADPAVRRAARDQPAVRGRARGGRLRPDPSGADRPHRALRRQGERAGRLPGGPRADRRADLRPLLPGLGRRAGPVRPRCCCWPTSAWPRPGP